MEDLNRDLRQLPEHVRGTQFSSMMKILRLALSGQQVTLLPLSLPPFLKTSSSTCGTVVQKLAAVLTCTGACKNVDMLFQNNPISFIKLVN